ncbi:MAG: HIT family protein [Rhodospirillaceae bacterium]|nr:HIT family protein [Rhodospirillaceae bacterium]
MFALHPALAADTIEIVDWPLSKILLMDDATYPWLILVPARPGLTGLHELGPSDGQIMMDEIQRASGALKNLYKPDRINVAALGNVVEQLHVHVIARFTSDGAWPAPVWGAQPRRPYGGDALAEIRATLGASLKEYAP